MPSAASVSFPEMTSLMEKIPDYRQYRTTAEAAAKEREFRHALGMLLKECGEYLLNVAEKKSQLMSTEMQSMIDTLIDRIGVIFRRLDREGLVCIVGDHDTTIGELEELDVRLMLLVEEAMELVHSLETGVPAASWFKSEAAILSRDLVAFSEVTEERNYLLGLGWESEFKPR